jgi:enoyl-CoA hydratase/carnithine racemase
MTDAPAFETIVARIDGPRGWLTLNRPEKLNALSLQKQQEIIDASAWFNEQPDLKVVVASGAGGTFSGGVDLSVLMDMPADAGEARAAADLGRRMADAVEDIHAVTVAAIEGHCVGGGVVLASAIDLRIAADDTYFSIPETAIGIPLLWGGITRLVREIGPVLTRELVLTCRPFSAAEALEAGFLNRVVAAEALDDAVEETVAVLLERSRYTLHATKMVVREATRSMADTELGKGDAARGLGALGDEESQAVAAKYFERFRNG